MQRFEDMADKSTNILRFNLTSYDLNLKKKKEDHIDEYTINPVQALLEYENVRPGVSGGYFNKDLMETCKRPNYGSVIDTIETENMITVVDKTTNKPKKVFYLINKVTRIEKLTDINAKPAFLHVDFSKRRDATAMGLVRPVYVQLDDEESPNWKIQLEALLKWQPFVGGDGYRREVSYEDVESLIDVFIDNRKVKYLSFDIYNNSATLQKYQNKGIICTEASVTVKSQLKFFTLLKELFVENRLILGKDNVNYSLVVEQLAGLVIHPQTGKITHGVLGKDLSDALANAVYQCYEWMVMKRLINKKAIHKGPAVISSGPGNISKVRSGVNNLNKVKAVTDLNKILKKLR
jgi:hypothetical protein